MDKSYAGFYMGVSQWPCGVMVPTWGGGYLTNFLRSAIFPILHDD